MPDPNIPEILTFITAPTFNTFSTNWSAKAHTGKASPKNKNQFNWS